MMDWNEFQKWCGALVAWREARGEGRDGMRAVLHVVANRAKAQNKSWAQIIYQKMQFSSMTYGGDPQLANIPVKPDPQFMDAYEIADLIFNGGDYDLTEGATFYFATSIPRPAWSDNMIQTAQVGHHLFFKERQ